MLAHGSAVPRRSNPRLACGIGADLEAIRILELLHAKWSLADVAAALGTYPREVWRVGWRYVERGIHAALTDDPRPKPREGPHSPQPASVHLSAD